MAAWMKETQLKKLTSNAFLQSSAFASSRRVIGSKTPWFKIRASILPNFSVANLAALAPTCFPCQPMLISNPISLLFFMSPASQPSLFLSLMHHPHIYPRIISDFGLGLRTEKSLKSALSTSTWPGYCVFSSSSGPAERAIARILCWAGCLRR